MSSGYELISIASSRCSASCQHTPVKYFSFKCIYSSFHTTYDQVFNIYSPFCMHIYLLTSAITKQTLCQHWFYHNIMIWKRYKNSSVNDIQPTQRRDEIVTKSTKNDDWHYCVRSFVFILSHIKDFLLHIIFAWLYKVFRCFGYAKHSEGIVMHVYTKRIIFY